MAEQLIPVHSSLALDVATAITDAALRLRRDHQLLPLAVMVLDAGGNVVSFRREDGCGVLRHDIALGKAWAALGMGMSTRLIAFAATLVGHWRGGMAYVCQLTSAGVSGTWTAGGS